MKKSFVKNLLNGVGKRMQFLAKNRYKQVNISWTKLKYYKHLPAGKLREHRMPGGIIYFTNPAELLHGLDEIFIHHLYQQKLRPQPYIIDCGANVGLSIIYLKKLFPQAEILAFEPDNKNFELLQKNVSSFDLDKVTLEKKAVWIENTVLKFSGEGTMSSKIDSHASKGSVQVEAIRLKDLLVREVDFLKIDIEGAEFEVIKDISPSLNLVKNLFVEYHGSFAQNHELTKLFTIFTENGFNYYIKEATSVYDTPFDRNRKDHMPYDVQLNIFCFKDDK